MEGQSRVYLCGPEHNFVLILSRSWRPLLLGVRGLDHGGGSTQTDRPSLHPLGKPKQADGWLYHLPSPLNVATGSCCRPEDGTEAKGAPLTSDTAEQAKAGGVPLPAVPRVVRPGRRERDPKPNGAVELPAPWLHGDNGAERGLVAQQFGDQLIWYGLGLRGIKGGPSASRSREACSRGAACPQRESRLFM